MTRNVPLIQNVHTFSVAHVTSNSLVTGSAFVLWNSWGWTQIIFLRLVPRLRMSGSIPPLQRSNRGGGEIFHTCPDRPWGPPSFLYNGYRAFPGGKVRPGRDADPSPHSTAEVKNRVELYLYCPQGPSWSMKGWNLPIPPLHTYVFKARKITNLLSLYNY
jgi:hypothetical protein